MRMVRTVGIPRMKKDEGQACCRYTISSNGPAVANMAINTSVNMINSFPENELPPWPQRWIKMLDNPRVPAKKAKARSSAIACVPVGMNNEPTPTAMAMTIWVRHVRFAVV